MSALYPSNETIVLAEEAVADLLISNSLPCQTLNSAPRSQISFSADSSRFLFSPPAVLLPPLKISFSLIKILPSDSLCLVQSTVPFLSILDELAAIEEASCPFSLAWGIVSRGSAETAASF